MLLIRFYFIFTKGSACSIIFDFPFGGNFIQNAKLQNPNTPAWSLAAATAHRGFRRFGKIAIQTLTRVFILFLIFDYFATRVMLRFAHNLRAAVSKKPLPKIFFGLSDIRH